MLGKLIKYEMKATGRILFPLYLLILVATVGFAVSVRYNEFFDGHHQPFAVLGGIFAVLLVAAVLVVVIMTVVLVVQRFYKNLLGHEGYLMFSLPVSTAENIACKSLTAFLWVIFSLLLGGLCAFLVTSIVGDFGGMMESMKLYWTTFVQSQDRAFITRMVILGVILFIVMILGTIGHVYAALAIGHQWNDHRILGSFLAYIGISFAENFLLSFLNQAQNLAFSVFSEGTVEPISATSAMILVIAVNAVLVVIYNLITWLLLDRRLNLE